MIRADEGPDLPRSAVADACSSVAADVEVGVERVAVSSDDDDVLVAVGELDEGALLGKLGVVARVHPVAGEDPLVLLGESRSTCSTPSAGARRSTSVRSRWQSPGCPSVMPRRRVHAASRVCRPKLRPARSPLWRQVAVRAEASTLPEEPKVSAWARRATCSYCALRTAPSIAARSPDPGGIRVRAAAWRFGAHRHPVHRRR
jgi:hypothetical protein